MTEFVALPDVPKKVNLENFVESFPIRSPGKTASAMRHLLRGKTICDVGCAKGDMVLKFGKYAKRSFGINNDPEETTTAGWRGAVVLYGNALKMKIPKADLYFMYWDCTWGDVFLRRMMKRHPGPFTIFCSGCAEQWFLKKYIDDWKPKTVYTFEYEEPETCCLDLAPAQGTWWLVAIEKPA